MVTRQRWLFLLLASGLGFWLVMTVTWALPAAATDTPRTSAAADLSALPGPVIINEVAWAGSSADTPDDEGIELYNSDDKAV